MRDLPGPDDSKQMEICQDTEAKTGSNFAPNHPNIRIVYHSPPQAPVGTQRLLNCRPCCDPAHTESETPGERGKHQIGGGHLLEVEPLGDQGTPGTHRCEAAAEKRK